MSKTQKTWLPLKAGDLIDIVAPGSRCSDDELKNGIQVLHEWGYRTRVSSNIFGDDVICANTDKARFEQFKKALMSKDSKAIWCARGGYGAIRLTNELIKLKPPQQNKLLIGYSDVTTLHHFLNQFWKWPSLHAPLLDRIGKRSSRPSDISDLQKSLSGDLLQITYSGLQPLNKAAQKKLNINARVYGGNLMVANSNLGGPLQKPYNGVVFFEETNERGYRVDRLLIQMQLAGLFKTTKAIVFGSFIGGKESDGKDMVTPVIERFAREQKIPVFRGLEVGHGDLQRPVFLNTPAQLVKSGATAELIISSGADQ